MRMRYVVPARVELCIVIDFEADSNQEANRKLAAFDPAMMDIEGGGASPDDLPWKVRFVDSVEVDRPFDDEGNPLTQFDDEKSHVIHFNNLEERID